MFENELRRLQAEIRANDAKEFSGYAERDEFAGIQARADRVFQASAKILPSPGDETASEYRVRLMRSLQSETSLRKTDLGAVINDSAALAKTEERIYAEAMETASRADALRPIVTTDACGRQITEFVGNMNSWMREFKKPAMIGSIFVENARASRDAFLG
jgi:hypothetical protein